VARLVVTDLRAGTVVLPDDPALPPVPVVPQAPGDPPHQPYGVVRLPDGRLVFADTTGHRVVAMAEDGSGWACFGTHGGGAGGLSSPGGVAAGPDGRIWVADTGNGRVVAVDSMAGDGWTEHGAGTLARPRGIAVDGGAVVVADPGAGRVLRLSTVDGGWEASPPGALRTPVAVALLPGGGIVAADLTARRLAFLDAPAAGVVAEVTDDELLAGPSAVVALSADLLAVCVAPRAALLAVSRVDGGWTVALDRRLSESGLRRPTALAA
jgi:NHL repeat